MRETVEFIKLTLREDADLIRALVEAIPLARSDYQVGVLRDVRRHIVERNRELTSKLYQLFLDILSNLKVDPPKVAGGGLDGGRFPIPRLEPGRGQRLTQRRDHRQQAWAEHLDRAGLAESDVDLMLTENVDRLETVMYTATSIYDELKDEKERDRQADQQAMIDRLTKLIEQQAEMIEHLIGGDNKPKSATVLTLVPKTPEIPA